MKWSNLNLIYLKKSLVILSVFFVLSYSLYFSLLLSLFILKLILSLSISPHFLHLSLLSFFFLSFSLSVSLSLSQCLCLPFSLSLILFLALSQSFSLDKLFPPIEIFFQYQSILWKLTEKKVINFQNIHNFLLN